MKRRALVTGNGEMGQAIVERLRADGFEIVWLNHQSPASASDAVLVDFSTDAAVLEAVGGLDGPLHAVAISHGLAERGTLDTLDPLDWRRVLDVNLNSVYTLLHGTLKLLSAGAGVVVVSSTAGLDRSKNSGPHYTAAKAGVNGLVRHLTPELAQRGIRINAVCAGLIDDELAAGVNTAESYSNAIEGIPLARAGTATEIANAVSFLLSGQASYITGSLLSVAGGTHR